MNCEYTLKTGKKTIKVNSLIELSKYYYKNGPSLSSQKIFSSDDTATNVINTLNAIANRTNEIKEDKTKIPTLEFITRLNTDILASIGLQQDRLAPEYIEEQRILHFILAEMPANLKTKVTTLDQLKNLIKDNEPLRNTFDSRYADIKEDLEVEKITNKLGIYLHKALAKAIRGEDLKELTDSLVDKFESDNPGILDNVKEWKKVVFKHMSKIHDEIKTILKNGGTVMSELDVDTLEGAAVQLKGIIDIVAIDSDGNVHLYDFKVSKKNYEDWDSAKVLTTDWQLAFYRGLLGQFIDVSNATLNVIPIAVGSPIDVNGKKQLLFSNFKYTKQVSLTQNSSKGLMPHGKLTTTVNKLIPQGLNFSYNEEKYNEFLADLKLLLADHHPKVSDYEIKTSNKEYNVDRIVAAAEAKDIYEIFSYFTDTDSIELEQKLNALGFIKDRNSIFKITWPAGTSKAEKVAKFRQAVEIYVEFAKTHRNQNLLSLKNTIVSAINGGKYSIEWHNPTVNVLLNKLLKPYLMGGHKVITAIKELDDLGMILLQNKADGKFVMISISAYNALASYNKDLAYGDLEYIKSFLFFNNYFKELSMDINKIEAIEVLSLQDATAYTNEPNLVFEKFLNLMKTKPIKINLASEHIPDIKHWARTAVHNALRTYSKTDKGVVEAILSPIMNTFLDTSLEDLKKVQKALRKQFPQLADKDNQLIALNFDSEIDYLYGLIATLIITKTNVLPHGDYIRMKNFAISFADFKSVFQSLYTDNQESYDRTGKAIQGIIGGLSTITPDKVPSADLRNINKLINGGNSFVRKDFYKQSTILNKLTRDYFKSINYSPTEQNWIGNYREKYNNFWVKDKNTGKVSNVWSVKNPYLVDSENNLTTAERKHLKDMLFEINKYRIDELGDTSKIDYSSLETLRNSNGGLEIIKKIESGEYFNMPLVRNQQISRNAAMWKDGFKGVVDKANLAKEEMVEAFDGRELMEEERINIKATELGFYEMYGIYESQTPEFKKQMVDENSPQYYELSLDIIAHRVAFNKIRQNHMNQILPIINSYMWWMKLSAGARNEDISKQLQYVADRIKLGVYDSPVVDEEFTDVINAVSVVKKITTAGMLALRPVLMFKELTVGLYKGIALASTQIYGKQQFGYASFFKAVSKLITFDKQFSPEWNIGDAINNQYGIANRDVNSSPHKLQTNRRGFWMGLSPWMYSTSTIPDFYNRMALFIAKMIEDGSYDAHTLVDGHLKYDPTKDERFSYYFKNRHLHVSPAGKYIPAKSDEKYNQQRNLYTLTLGEINDERMLIGKDPLKEETDLIPDAYSEKERLSYKSFIDTVYGYYDKDSQANWHNYWYGIVYLQFMQFWPGKMSMWYGKEIPESSSLMGEHVQKFRINEKGEKVLIWRKPIYSDTNPEEIIDFEEVEEYTGDPMLIFKGTKQEALASSMLKSTRYLLTGDMGKFESEELLKNRALFGIADGLLMMLILGLVSAFVANWIADNGTDGIDGQTMAFVDKVNSRVLNEANLYKSTFGALSSTPAFFSYGTQIVGDIGDVFTGDKNISELSQRIKAFELINM